MSKDFARRGSFCGVQAEKGREQGSASGSQDGKLGSKNVPTCLRCAWETE